MRDRHDDATKAEALQLAEEHSAAEASRRTGVPAATIRAWRHREGRSRPPAGVDPVDWAAQRRAGALEAWSAAQDALARCRDLIEDGDPRKAQAASVVFGVLVDKSAVLQTAAAQAEERQAKIAQDEAQLLVGVVEATWRELGVPLGAAGRKVLGHYVKQASGGTIVEGTAPDARAAARELREAVLSEAGGEVLGRLSDDEVRVEAERRGVLPVRLQSPRALPAGRVAGLVGEGQEREEPARPVDVEDQEEDDAVDGVVVDEGSWAFGPAGDDDGGDPVVAVHWDDDAWRSA